MVKWFSVFHEIENKKLYFQNLRLVYRVGESPFLASGLLGKCLSLKNKCVLKIDSKCHWENFSGRSRACPALCEWSRVLSIRDVPWPIR